MNPEIDKFGNKIWYNKKGQYHREDGPAIEWSIGNKWWYLDGWLLTIDEYISINPKFLTHPNFLIYCL